MSDAGNRSGRMPVIFIGHGSPMNIILDNDFTSSLKNLGEKLPIPRSILVISAHWLTEGTVVNSTAKPGLIYDFYGFPGELNNAAYPCPGSPEDAELVVRTVAGHYIRCDMERGLDHASWAVLKHMYPEAGIPVFEMSIDYSHGGEYHYNLGMELAPLRDEGILILASGNLVHNLGLMDYNDIDAAPFGWALEADAAIRNHLLNREHEKLIDYRNLGIHGRLAVPTLEHFLPMLAILGLQGGEQIAFIHEGIQYGSISMRSFIIP